MLENLHKAHHHARHNLERSHERNREYYDRKAKPVNIKVGDPVYFRDPTEAATRSSKLASHWKPFYRVIKALSDVTFVIKNQLSGGTKVANAQNLRLADTNDLWKNTSEEPTSINYKYERDQKSLIPVRVQPPRRSKLSAFDEELPADSESDTESEAERIPPVKIPLPVSDTDSDEEDIPLSDLQKCLKRKKSQCSESEDDTPLSEIAKRLKDEKQPEPAVRPGASVKRRPPSESDSLPLPDIEIAEPPEKYGIHTSSDLESDIPEMDAVDLTAGACVRTTNPPSCKTSLMAQLMQMQAQNQTIMERMLTQLEKM